MAETTDTTPKVALITGGGRGIGRACALDLAKHGFDIVLVDLIEDDLARTAGEIADLGRQALTFVADVRDYRRAAEIVAEVDAHWGRIDVLFNNAGKPMPKMEPMLASWRLVSTPSARQRAVSIDWR